METVRPDTMRFLRPVWRSATAGASGAMVLLALCIPPLAARSAERDSPPEPPASFPVTIRVDAAREAGELRPIWRFFGYDEPNYTYMPQGRKLLSQLAALNPEARVYVRTHNLLTSGDGTPALKWGSTGVYAEDADGNPRYDWRIVDQIFDTYFERGMRPLVEIGFMPEALSSNPRPYQHHWAPGANYGEIFTGWACPPKDYRKWAELVRQWTLHCVERYGAREVEQWYWEVWNEPNIGYWRGTPAEFHRLYDHAVDAVRRALPGARVGGPHSTGPRDGRAAGFLRDFLEHCLRGTNYATGQVGSPLDYIAFHAKGAPRYVDSHVRMGIAAQLQDIDRGFEIVASYPELRSRPIIIGESDPDGCAACSARVYPQNGYRNGPLYASYTAAAFARKQLLADKHHVNFQGAVTWAFEFEDQPWFDGFRALASNGIELPVLNVFRMFGKMGGRRVVVESTADAGLEALCREGVRGAPDVSALAAVQERKLSVLIWHYHDNDTPGSTAAVRLSVTGLPGKPARVSARHWRIDEAHSNAFAVWKQLGSPQKPTLDQRAQLDRAAQLALLGAAELTVAEDGRMELSLSLPRQAVSLLELEW